VQPVRYGDAANLSLALLGLPAVPGSTFNVDQSLRVTPVAGQMTLVFQQGLEGYDGTVDTYVRRHEGGNSYGTRSTFVVDDADPWWSGRDNQALLRFDKLIGPNDRQLPSNALVQQASLSLRVVNAGSGGAFHRMRRAWSDEDTWNSLDGGLSADDSEAVRQADVRVTNVSQGSLTIDVTASVQAWAGGEENHGWAILPDGSDGWDAYSAEGFMPPRLTVTYGYAAYAARSLPKESAAKTEASELKAVEETLSVATLIGNYPNPFSEETTIRFSLPQAERVRLEVFDIQGHPVRVLADEIRAAGTHRVAFEAQGLATGLYLVRLATSGRQAATVQSSTMMVVR
jgi:hypothetical protein